MYQEPPYMDYKNSPQAPIPFLDQPLIPQKDKNSHTKALFSRKKGYNKRVRHFSIAFLIIGLFDAITTIVTISQGFPDVWGVLASSLYMASGLVGLYIKSKSMNQIFSILLVVLLIFNFIALVLGVIAVLVGSILSFQDCEGKGCEENETVGMYFFVIGIASIIFYGILCGVVVSALVAASRQIKKIEKKEYGLSIND